MTRIYRQWAGNEKGTPEDLTRCVVIVADRAYRSVLTHQCARPRGYGPDGEYCALHAKRLADGQHVPVPKVFSSTPREQSKMKLEVGAIYRVTHPRKGTFTGKVLAVNDDFVDMEIVDGTARYIAENDRGAGEKLSIRASLATFESVGQ